MRVAGLRHDAPAGPAIFVIGTLQPVLKQGGNAVNTVVPDGAAPANRNNKSRQNRLIKMQWQKIGFSGNEGTGFAAPVLSGFPRHPNRPCRKCNPAGVGVSELVNSTDLLLKN